MTLETLSSYVPHTTSIHFIGLYYRSIMHRLKLINRLNNVAFDSLLGRNIDTLDLSDAVLTVKTLKLLGQRCPHLKELSLKRCGYIVTDHTLEILLQVTDEN